MRRPAFRTITVDEYAASAAAMASLPRTPIRLFTVGPFALVWGGRYEPQTVAPDEVLPPGAYRDLDGLWLPLPDVVGWDRDLASVTVGGDPVMTTSTHYLAEPAW